MTLSERIHQQQQAASARTKAFVLPAALAVTLFVAIVYIQFSLVLGKNGFLALFPLGIAFYYCWAWHRRLSAKADAAERAAGKG